MQIPTSHNMSKDDYIHVRIDIEEKVALINKLKPEGLTPSDFVRAYIKVYLEEDT